MALCTALAALFNRWLENGTPTSHGFRHSVTTTILKHAPPGAYPNSTAHTHGLAVGNMLRKLFELVILARLTHWAVNENIVSTGNSSPSHWQLGFKPLLGAEMHVLTLLETLKMRRAVGRDTYALRPIRGHQGSDNVPRPLVAQRAPQRGQQIWEEYRPGDLAHIHTIRGSQNPQPHPPADSSAVPTVRRRACAQLAAFNEVCERHCTP